MRWFAGWLYFLGGAAVLVGAALYLFNEPKAPTEKDLVWYEGEVVGIRLKEDLDATDIVYLFYRDDDIQYKYYSKFPQYVEIRDRLGIYRQVDVLIEKDAVPDSDGALTIWGLVEHDPYNEGTVVTFEEIYEEATQTDRSWQNVGLYVLGGGFLGLVTAFGIRRAVPYVAKAPTA